MKNYFDTHFHSHAYHWDPKIYDDIFKFLHDNAADKGMILDLGCGDGSFLKQAIKSGINSRCLGTDVSFNMIKMARDNLSDFHVDLVVCDGFSLPVKDQNQFDLIHIDSVLHHLIGKTRSRSLKLVTNMLESLIGKVSNNGVLVIEEVYYDSYLFQSFTTAVIFYGLKLLNLIHLDLNQVIKEIQLGLEVNFLSTGQLKYFLERLEGKSRLLKKDSWAIPIFYRILLLKDRGHITYLHKL